MCAILDNDVAHQVFGRDRPPAGVAFRRWIDSGRGQLVVGGQLRRELAGTQAFRLWLQQALLEGRARSVNDSDVEKRTTDLRQAGVCRSNDPHIVALAQLSNARLLYSNDDALRHDFGNKQLIDQPRGKVHSTKQNNDFQESHRRLLNQRKLCRR